MRQKIIVLGLFVLLLITAGCVRRVVVYEQTPLPPPRVEVITIKPYPILPQSGFPAFGSGGVNTADMSGYQAIGGGRNK